MKHRLKTHEIVVICIVIGVVIIAVAVYINNKKQQGKNAAHQPLGLTVLQDAEPLALLVPVLA